MALFFLIAAMPPLCALVGALLIGYPMQRFGRRIALIGLSVPFFLGFILMGFTYLVQHKSILFIGRLMSGLMNGAATPASQIYVRMSLTRNLNLMKKIKILIEFTLIYRLANAPHHESAVPSVLLRPAH